MCKTTKSEKIRKPIFGYDYKHDVTFIAALYPEGNVQVYWCNDPDDGTGTWTAQQFSALYLLMGMWGTMEIHTGLPFRIPFKFQRQMENLKFTTFAEFYRQNMTTYLLTTAERKGLGISDEEYIRANKERWGEGWGAGRDIENLNGKGIR